MLKACVRCQGTQSGPQAFLLTCSECKRAWHHRCHAPPVSDQELIARISAFNNNDIDNGLDAWVCRRCLKARAKAQEIPPSGNTAKSLDPLAFEAQGHRSTKLSHKSASRSAGVASSEATVREQRSKEEDVVRHQRMETLNASGPSGSSKAIKLSDLRGKESFVSDQDAENFLRKPGMTSTHSRSALVIDPRVLSRKTSKTSNLSMNPSESSITTAPILPNATSGINRVSSPFKSHLDLPPRRVSLAGDVDTPDTSVTPTESKASRTASVKQTPSVTPPARTPGLLPKDNELLRDGGQQFQCNSKSSRVGGHSASISKNTPTRSIFKSEEAPGAGSFPQVIDLSISIDKAKPLPVVSQHSVNRAVASKLPTSTRSSVSDIGSRPASEVRSSASRDILTAAASTSGRSTSRPTEEVDMEVDVDPPADGVVPHMRSRGQDGTGFPEVSLLTPMSMSPHLASLPHSKPVVGMLALAWIHDQHPGSGEDSWDRSLRRKRTFRSRSMKSKPQAERMNDERRSVQDLFNFSLAKWVWSAGRTTGDNLQE